MMNHSPIYKFASLRSPKSDFPSSSTKYLTLDTDIVDDLTDIVESNDLQEVKLENYNNVLQTYIDSVNFIKTKKDCIKYLKDTPNTQEKLKKLYNNIVVRTLTKSNTNQIFKLLVDGFKEVIKILEPTIEKFEISIPESITPAFIGFKGANNEQQPEDTTLKNEILKKLNNLSRVESLLFEAEKDNISLFDSEGKVVKRNLQVQSLLSYLGKESITTLDAKNGISAELIDILSDQKKVKIFNREIGTNVSSTIEEELKNDTLANIAIVNQLKSYQKLILSYEEQSITTINAVLPIETNKYDLVYAVLDKTNFTVEEAFAFVAEEMKGINNKLKTLIETEKYSFIGSKWVNVSNFEHAYKQGNIANNIFVRHNECDLKFPYQIADLRVVETESVGYLPGEIAHINNTQAGEKHLRETRRLKRTESFESYMIDEETFRETDTQSTEKFSLENVSSEIQSKANGISVYTSASGSFGPVSASVDAGFSNSSSSTNASIVAQKEAKEVIERVVDRVSKRVRSERSTLTIEEFEEKVIHEIDNGSEGTKSYVYRWLNKLVRGTLKNYGKRLIFEFDIVHPSHYYLSRSIKEIPTLDMPKDPRESSIGGNPVLTIDNITRDNYHIWSTLYKVDIERPPAAKVIISETLNGTQTTTTSKMVAIPDDYFCYSARASSYYYDYLVPAYLICTVGVWDFASWGNGVTYFWNNAQIWCAGETRQIPISVSAGEKGFYVNIEIECHLSHEAYRAWKISTYNSIVAAYEELLNQLEEKKNSFDPNNPGINPLKKDQMVKDEIKRETIRKMFRCNPFWLKDNYVVGKEYNPVCCYDGSNAEKVKFIETTFDWANMTYQLHPYFYSDKNNWNELLLLSDDNPHFEAFMQSSYATVRVPVHRDELKERAAMNFLQFNSIANYDVLPEGLGNLLNEVNAKEPAEFDHDINGNKLPVAVDIIDLGIFKLPTDLVILECGNRDGVKPIGFPEAERPDTDVSIPKQYSPAIIADSCETPILPPSE